MWEPQGGTERTRVCEKNKVAIPFIFFFNHYYCGWFQFCVLQSENEEVQHQEGAGRFKRGVLLHAVCPSGATREPSHPGDPPVRAFPALQGGRDWRFFFFFFNHTAVCVLAFSANDIYCRQCFALIPSQNTDGASGAPRNYLLAAKRFTLQSSSKLQQARAH